MSTKLYRLIGFIVFEMVLLFQKYYLREKINGLELLL